MSTFRLPLFGLLASLLAPVQAAIITVDSTSSAASLPDACTLRAAMVSATSGVAQGTCARGDLLALDAGPTVPYPVNVIRLPPAGVITLVEASAMGLGDAPIGLAPIAGVNVAIDGRGATIERGAGLTCNLDGNIDAGEFGLFELVGVETAPGRESALSLVDVTLRNGCVDAQLRVGGAARLIELGPGGRTRLLLDRVRLLGHRSRGPGGAIGVGLPSTAGAASITIRHSLLASNESRNAGGGAVSSERGELRISGSTFQANRAQTSASALRVGATPVFEVTDSTFDGQQIAAFVPGEAGGTIVAAGVQRLLLRHNTIAGGRDPGQRRALQLSLAASAVALLQSNWMDDNLGGNCASLAGLLVVGRNVSNDATCADFSAVASGQLKPLGAWGGQVLTRPPISGSSAIDTAPCEDLETNAPLPADARGVPRPQDGDAVAGAMCDPGAAEFARNQPPTIDLPPPRTAVVGTPLPLGATSGPIRIDDPLEHGLAVALRLEPRDGRVSIDTTGLTCTTGDGEDDLLLVCRAPLPALNAALRTLVYRPDPGFIGNEVLRVEVDDLGAGGDDGLPRGAVADLAIAVVANAAQIDVSPAQIDLGEVPIGVIGAPATITLRNAGNLPATGLSIAWSGSSGMFRYTNGCATSLAPGTSCALTVKFAPTADVSLSTVLAVDRDNSTGPLTARVTARSVVPAGWLFGSSFEDDIAH